MIGRKTRATRSNGRAERPTAPTRRHFPVLWRALLTPLLAVPILLAGTGHAAPPSLASSTSYLYPSFGSGGEDLLSPSGQSEPQAQAQAVAPVPPCPSSGSCAWSGIQNDVVAAGYESTGSSNGSQLAIAVVNPTTGAKASSFDSGSLLTDSLGQPATSTVQATGVAVYPACPSSEPSCPWASKAGDVIVTGTVEASASAQEDIFVAAYSPTTTGSAIWHADITPSGYIASSGTSLALSTTGSSPSGDVVVAGTVFLTTGGPQQPVVAAVTPAGALDTSFGSAATGEEVGDLYPSENGESLSSVLVDKAGNIVVAGTWSGSSGVQSVFAARLLPAGATSGCGAAPSCGGALDDRFGGSSCAITPTCSGAAPVSVSGSNLVSAGAALENLTGTCSGEPSCYDVLVAATDSPTSGSSNSVVAVAAVTQAGAKATSFGGGLVKLPAQSTNATGTGIAIQSTGSTVTGVLVSGYTAGSTSTNGQATVSRLGGTGSVVTSFGSNGTYVVPSRTSQFLPPGLGLAVTWVPNSLDFMMAGALLGSSDTQPRFALARVIGEVVAMSASVTRDTHAANTDYVTVKLTAPAAAPASISVKYTLKGTGGLTFSPSSGTITIAKGATTGSARAVVYFPPLVGNQTIYVDTTNGSGLTAVTSPTTAVKGADSPFGAAPKPGYWLINKLGSVYSFQAPFRGGVPGHPKSLVVAAATNGNGNGYWMVTASGSIYAFDVPYRGAYPGTSPSPIVAIAADPATTAGYWIFSQAGNVYAFGGAPLYGQGSHLNGKVVSAAAAPDGLGYWLVTSTGAVYGYGPGAKYHGGASHPAAPIVAMAADLHTGGYWLVTAKGVVYAFGAPNYGSATGQDATSISPDPATNGYWVLLANGGVYSFSAKYYGSAAPYHPNSALISIVGR